jgi:hypothetical protein
MCDRLLFNFSLADSRRTTFFFDILSYIVPTPLPSNETKTNTLSVSIPISPSSTSPSEPSKTNVKIKLALCDLDGCLIKTRGNSSFPKNRDDWQWWSGGVKKKLFEWHEDG